MYKELDVVLSEECTEDSWYDDGFMYAQELLKDFTDSDWENIFENINGKSNKWKGKLAYCIDDELGEKGLNLLFNMLNADEELIELIIDSLRSFNSQGYKEMITSNHELMNKAKNLLENSSLPVKKMIENFLENIYN